MPADVWEFDRETLSLVNGTRAAHLTRKAGDVLACLIRNHGRVVSQQQLLREVWPNLHVTPDLVREYVSDLRSVLGDDPRAPALIETVRGRGYRLVGGIRAVPAAGGPAPLIRVAVLGLADRSLDARWTRLAQGLADDLAAELSRYSDVAVIAHREVEGAAPGFDLRGVARDLGVRYLVTGSVAVTGGTVRALFQLVDGATCRIQWTRRFAEPAIGFPRLIEEVAAGVASSLGGVLGEVSRLERELVRRKPPGTLDAYENFLIGCDAEARPTKEDMHLAVRHLERALEMDPTFARCWMMLGWACFQIQVSQWAGDPQLWQRRCHEAMERAFECDPRDPVIVADLANLRGRQGRQSEALTLIERAADLSENQAEASTFLSLGMCLVAGDGCRALALVDRSLELNPEPPAWHRFFESRAAFFAREYVRGIDSAAKATDFLPKHVYRCLSAAELGQAEIAREFWSELRASFPDFDLARYPADATIVHPEALEQYRTAAAKLAAITT